MFPAWFRERVCYESVLFLYYFHMVMIPHQCDYYVKVS